jgi:glycerol-3-phosphate dehydrogenase (NAD(P)+)
MKTQITVIGSGAFGLTLANVLADNNHAVKVWTHSEDTRNHPDKLKLMFNFDMPIHPGISWETNLAKACEGSAYVLLVVASHFIAGMAAQLKTVLKPQQILILATKGIDDNTHQSMLEIVEAQMPAAFHPNIYVLSGPNIARDIVQKLPSVTVVAGTDKTVVAALQKIISNDYFRVYGSTDRVGVHLGGSLKNVIALAAGISDGLGLGDNAKAALIVRGLKEISDLALKMGAQKESMYGLAGMGDLIVTCMSKHSRNYSVGVRLAQGTAIDEILGNMKEVAEGVRTAKSVVVLAKKYAVEVPIAWAVHQVIYDKKNVQQAFYELMHRELVFEN